MITLLATSAVVFFMSEALGGDIAYRVLGRTSSPEQRELFRRDAGLDQPAQVRYVKWLEGIAQGDLGRSILTGHAPVGATIGRPLKNTLWLALYALILYFPLTLAVATLSAVFRDSWFDRIVSAVTLVALSLPEFVFGTLLIYVFSIKFNLLPALSFILPGASLIDHIRALTLPAVVVAVVMAVYAIRHLRDSLLEVLEGEYVRTAELKGVPRRRVVLRHALPNSLGPMLNVTALNLTYLVGGLVVVELVFAYEGIGKLFIDSISFSDLPVIEALSLIAAAVYILGNLVADVAAILLNPRLRQG